MHSFLNTWMWVSFIKKKIIILNKKLIKDYELNKKLIKDYELNKKLIKDYELDSEW